MCSIQMLSQVCMISLLFNNSNDMHLNFCYFFIMNLIFVLAISFMIFMLIFKVIMESTILKSVCKSAAT